MNVRNLLKYLLFATALAVVLLALGSIDWARTAPVTNTGIVLQRPPFLGVAQAQDAAVAPAGIGSILDAEAGISAYFKAPDGISLSQVRGLFRTIEKETTDYIIGSVPVPTYPEHFDAHVYVNKNGWVLAYYLRDAPVAKIVSVLSRNLSGDKLATVVSTIAGAAGAPFSTANYYDFRYPNATNILFVAEDAANGNVFTIQVPSTYAYFERSWTIAADVGCIAFDGTQCPNQLYNVGSIRYGTLTAAQVTPDVVHTMAISSYGVLVIVYRVP